MSNERKPKEETQISHVFSISIGENQSTIPGVTQLINPRLLAEKEAQKKAKEAQSKPTPPPVAPSPPSFSASPPTQTNFVAEEHSIAIDMSEVEAPTPLAQAQKTPILPQKNANDSSLTQMGVHFELQFVKEQGNFRYHRMIPHGKARFEMWQEKFFYQMKLDLKTLEIQISFQEFQKGKNAFQEDAFGLSESNFVQVVRLENDQEKIYVLLSEKSLLIKQDEVRQALLMKSGGAQERDGGDFKIELAS